MNLPNINEYKLIQFYFVRGDQEIFTIFINRNDGEPIVINLENM